MMVKESQSWQDTIIAARILCFFVTSFTPFVQALDRVRVMEESNPTFILRNWIAQDSIAAAEAGDFSKVRIVKKYQ